MVAVTGSTAAHVKETKEKASGKAKTITSVVMKATSLETTDWNAYPRRHVINAGNGNTKQKATRDAKEVRSRQHHHSTRRHGFLNLLIRVEKQSASAWTYHCRQKSIM